MRKLNSAGRAAPIVLAAVRPAKGYISLTGRDGGIRTPVLRSKALDAGPLHYISIVAHLYIRYVLNRRARISTRVRKTPLILVYSFLVAYDIPTNHVSKVF